MNILSLFDGISCGQVALESAGIVIDNYYDCEIDKYAIQVTQKNYPNTIQLGDVTKIDFTPFIGKIDLLIGGSPCQDLSTLGNRKGLDGDKSSLFYEYIRALKEIKPKYFLLENNANMPKQAMNTISEMLGVKPIEINSTLVSAQNRKRLYWFNWEINKLADKNIKLVDIMQEEREEITLLPFVLKKLDIIKNKYGYIPQMFNPYNATIVKDKSPCLTCSGNRQSVSSTVIIYQNNKFSKLTPLEWERLQTLPDGYTDCVANSHRYNICGNGWTVDVIAHMFKGLVNA